jgi:hypothetical protein
MGFQFRFGARPAEQFRIPAHSGEGAKMVEIDYVEAQIDTATGELAGLSAGRGRLVKKNDEPGEVTTTVYLLPEQVPPALRAQIEQTYAEAKAEVVADIDWEA